MHIALEDVSASAGSQSTDHLNITAVGRENDDSGVREFFLDLCDCLGAIQIRHLKVHQGHFGTEPAKLFDRFRSGRSFSNDLHVGFGVHKGGDAFAEQRVIIHGEDPNDVRNGCHSFLLSAGPGPPHWRVLRERILLGRTQPVRHSSPITLA